MIFKRGVSSIVANVLIVLLVVVGVAVLWAAVKPVIDRTADTVQSDCFTVQLEPLGCPVDVGATTPGFTTLVGLETTLLKRNSGAGDLREVKLVYEGSVYDSASLLTSSPSRLRSGTAIVTSDASSLEELETVSIPSVIYNSDPVGTNLGATLSALAGATQPAETFIPESVKAYAVVGDNKVLCEIATASIGCQCTSSLSAISCP